MNLSLVGEHTVEYSDVDVNRHLNNTKYPDMLCGFLPDTPFARRSNPIFAEKIREWLKTMRKNNVAIIFATQNLTDIRNSSISSAIIESCLTKIFLPNANALNPADTEVYEYFNLNETERMIISKAIPKRQYYYKSILGSRLFELALSPFALAYMASASKEDQAAIIRFKTEFPEEDFNELWLKYKNVPKALKAYKEYKAMKII